MEIRPKPEMIVDWAIKIGFVLERQVELPPYHFGLVFIKKSENIDFLHKIFMTFDYS